MTAPCTCAPTQLLAGWHAPDCKRGDELEAARIMARATTTWRDPYCTPVMVALRKMPGASTCVDEECDLSGGYSHVGPCEPCACPMRHALIECDHVPTKKEILLAARKVCNDCGQEVDPENNCGCCGLCGHGPDNHRSAPDGPVTRPCFHEDCDCNNFVPLLPPMTPERRAELIAKADATIATLTPSGTVTHAGRLDAAMAETFMAELLKPSKLERAIDAGIIEIRPADQHGKTSRRPGVMGGTECFAGTRIPIAAVWSFLKSGWEPAAIVEQYPTLTLEDVQAVAPRVGELAEDDATDGCYDLGCRAEALEAQLAAVREAWTKESAAWDETGRVLQARRCELEAQVEKLTEERDAQKARADRCVAIALDSEHALAELGAGEYVHGQETGAARHAAYLAAQLVELRRQLTFAQQNNRQRNLELDALHYVWCSGGCKTGVHRWTPNNVSEEIVSTAERIVARLRRWFEHAKQRGHATPPCSPGHGRLVWSDERNEPLCSVCGRPGLLEDWDDQQRDGRAVDPAYGSREVVRCWVPIKPRGGAPCGPNRFGPAVAGVAFLWCEPESE